MKSKAQQVHDKGVSVLEEPIEVMGPDDGGNYIVRGRYQKTIVIYPDMKWNWVIISGFPPKRLYEFTVMREEK